MSSLLAFVFIIECEGTSRLLTLLVDSAVFLFARQCRERDAYIPGGRKNTEFGDIILAEMPVPNPLGEALQSARFSS